MSQLRLDIATIQNMEHAFSIQMSKMRHLFYFLDVYAEKGQVSFVKTTVRCLEIEMYYLIASKMPHPNIDFERIRKAFEKKISKMVENLTRKYLEKAIVVYTSQL